jgi:hypothetical protein
MIAEAMAARTRFVGTSICTDPARRPSRAEAQWPECARRVRLGIRSFHLRSLVVYDVGPGVIVRTNRELYRFAMNLLERRANSTRSLDEWLRSMLGLLREYPGGGGLSGDTFAALLERAYEADLVPFDKAWLTPALRDPNIENTFAGLEKLLLVHIAQLHEMAQAGLLDDEARYFGVNPPRGVTWYNFTPATYIECGVMGSVGGWEPGDESGRAYVPGQVARFDADGALTTVDPRDLDDPEVEVLYLTWEDLGEFFEAGKTYE